MDPTEPRTATLPPNYQAATPGFGGAIMDALRAIVQAAAPRGIMQRGAKIDQAVDQQSGAPQTTDLGNQF
jgi:hypothetical protein